MSGDDRAGRPAPRGRRRPGPPAEALPIAWSVDDADGPLQGPLALEFLRGRRLELTLAAGQTALLLGEGRLRAVYRPGRHALEIGDGEGRLSPRWRLLFLTPGEGLALRWTAEAPLRCGAARGAPGGGDEGRDAAMDLALDPAPDLPLIGTCRLEFASPEAFHDTFLAGVDLVDPAFTLALVDRLVQGAVAARLRTALPGAPAWSPAAVQARLTALRPADLADELEPCGLACRQLALYTAHPPVERDRPEAAPRPAAEPLPMSGHSEDLRRH